MTINSAYVSVASTATALNVANTRGNRWNGQYKGVSLLVKNPSASVTVYLGGSDVTADTTAGTGGYPLAPGAEVAISVVEDEILYGRVASGTQSVNVIRQGV